MNFTLIKCGPHFLLRVIYPPLEYGQNISTLFLIIINVLSSCVATLGNGLVLMTLKNSKVLKGPTYTLTATLSTLDFLVGVLLQPIFTSIVGAPIFKTTNLCFIFNWVFRRLAPVLASNSLAVLTLIALERLCAVIFPYNYKRVITNFRAALAVGLVILFNFVSDIILKVIGQVQIQRSITTTLRAFDYFIMLTSYISIIIALKTRKRQHGNKCSIEITKTLALASFVCGFCWLPFIISLPFVKRLSKSQDPGDLVKVINILWWTITLYLGNSAANIAVYCYQNTVMRREMKLQAKGIYARFLSAFQRTNAVGIAEGEIGVASVS